MTADLRAAYNGLATNNPLFAGVAPREAVTRLLARVARTE